MSRIRSIKPEFFKHEELQDLETANPGQHVMLVYAGLWTQCDKNGAFLCKARAVKNEVLPYIDFDMQKTLDILESGGFFVRYRAEGKDYGHIPAFAKYQYPSKNEKNAPAKYPEPPQARPRSFPGAPDNAPETHPETHPGNEPETHTEPEGLQDLRILGSQEKGYFGVSSETPPAADSQNPEKGDISPLIESSAGFGENLNPEAVEETPQNARECGFIASKEAKTSVDTPKAESSPPCPSSREIAETERPEKAADPAPSESAPQIESGPAEISDGAALPPGFAPETSLVPARPRSPPARAKGSELSGERLDLFHAGVACFESSERTKALMYQDRQSTARYMANIKLLVTRCSNIAPGLSAQFMRGVLEHFRAMCEGRYKGRWSFTPNSLMTGWIWEIVMETMPREESPELRQALRGLFG